MEIDQLNSVSPINPKEENLPTIEDVSVSPKETQNNKTKIGIVATKKILGLKWINY